MSVIRSSRLWREASLLLLLIADLYFLVRHTIPKEDNPKVVNAPNATNPNCAGPVCGFGLAGGAGVGDGAWHGAVVGLGVGDG